MMVVVVMMKTLVMMVVVMMKTLMMMVVMIMKTLMMMVVVMMIMIFTDDAELRFSKFKCLTLTVNNYTTTVSNIWYVVPWLLLYDFKQHSIHGLSSVLSMSGLICWSNWWIWSRFAGSFTSSSGFKSWKNVACKRTAKQMINRCF